MKLYSYTLKNLAMILIGLLWSSAASANLILNGSFEDNPVTPNSWAYFPAASVNGWEGSNIEIWNNYTGVSAAQGNQFAELNAHPYTGAPFSIYQSFATLIGQSYNLSFYYRARVDDSEQFSFSVDNLGGVLSDHQTSSWSYYSNSFVASSNFTTLTFSTLGAGTLGNFLDGVVVVRIGLYESSPLVLLSIGLLGLGLIRRRSL